MGGLTLFCGEILRHTTASQLKKRFPQAKIYNTYGPTETTVAVTSIEITEKILATYDPLPIGHPAPHAFFEIDTPQTDGPCPRGELIIRGTSVSPGYLNDSQKTQASFEGEGTLRFYRTGDWGYRQDELLFCTGRRDNQIKISGYRVELEDIECKLVDLPYITNGAVIPRYRGSQCVALDAAVVIDWARCDPLSSSELTTRLHKDLAFTLPPYMIPKNISFVRACL